MGGRFHSTVIYMIQTNQRLDIIEDSHFQQTCELRS